MVLAGIINWWMPCSFLLRLKGPNVFLFVSQARKTVCHGLNAEPGLTLSDQNINYFVKLKQKVHHRGLRMRELKDSRRVFGVSRCQIRLKSSFGEHAQVHFLLRWGYTKERLLIIKSVISVCWKLRMKFMQSGVLTISKQFGKPCLQ